MPSNTIATSPKKYEAPTTELPTMIGTRPAFVFERGSSWGIAHAECVPAKELTDDTGRCMRVNGGFRACFSNALPIGSWSSSEEAFPCSSFACSRSVSL